MTPQTFSLFLYNLSLLPVVFFSVLFLMLALLNLLVEKKRTFIPLKKLPFVSVHIPTFNDPIAVRCIKHCLKFDYPKDRYEIIIADDSTHVKTQQLLSRIADSHTGFVKYIHRENRAGFKSGALNNALDITKGEIIVVFDADWIPGKGFLREIVQPFSNPKVAIVQSRQGFYNKDINTITRFAAYTLSIYHTILMPINNRINCVFFCGTAGALRKSAFVEVGGWNTESLTEDSDLSVRLLRKGYDTVFLDMETPSEVPDTFENFLKQQMRWCYGNVHVFMDNWQNLLFKKGLTLRQRFMITFITLANSVAPMVIMMTFFGFAGWFLGEPTLLTLGDVYTFIFRFVITAGFLLVGVITLFKRRQLHELPHFVFASLTMGLILAVATGIAFFRALFNIRPHWSCTPKADNAKIK
ncbi:MAG: glycosyltransferase family 2 protein [archaeon]